jgi:hypothetical protein
MKAISIRTVVAGLLLLSLATLILAQEEKAWSEWSEKDAEKVLNDSPWGQTQIDTNTSEMTYSPTSGSSGGSGNRAVPSPGAGLRGTTADINRNRAAEGAYNQAVDIKYRVRFLSARPIREALANRILFEQPTSKAEDQPHKNDKLKHQMQEFIDRNYDEFIIVVVNYEATDQRLSAKAFQDLGSATAQTLRNKCYLERADGKRLYLVDYRVPIGDGLGAKFVFPRRLEGKPFLNKDSGDVRFYSEIGATVKLNRRFKVSDMVYKNKLEY